jgi:hypothetical protein
VLANGWWLSPGTPASSTKTDRHDKAEILLKVALRDNKSINQSTKFENFCEVSTRLCEFFSSTI